MKGKEDLFQLIRSMSPSEKRYFTLDAQKSSRKGSRYLELFQAINAGEEYDEEALRRQFPRSLPFDKAYLYEAILRSMRDYHSAKLRSARIKERLLDARYLFERNLYTQCEVRLEEARQLATDLGDHLALLEVNREFRRLILARKGRHFEERLATLAREGRQLLAASDEDFVYVEIYEQLLSRVIRKFGLHRPEEREVFLASFPRERLAEENRPGHALARLKYLQSNALYHQLLGDFEQVMHYFSLVVDWWEDHPKYKEEEFYRYIIDFANLLHAYTTNDQIHRLPPLLRQLENTEPDSETARQILFQKVTIYRLIAHINLGITEDLDRLLADIADGIDKYTIPSTTRSTLLFNTGFLLFIQGRFADALLWFGRILDDRKNPYRQDIRTATSLLHLVATFELDNDQLLEAAYRSAYRFLRKHDQLKEGGFETRVLDCIRQLMSEPADEWPAIWRGFQEYLQQVMADPAVTISHGLDQLLHLWTKSRLSRRPISQLMVDG